jgi:hypothetical protein
LRSGGARGAIESGEAGGSGRAGFPVGHFFGLVEKGALLGDDGGLLGGVAGLRVAPFEFEPLVVELFDLLERGCFFVAFPSEFFGLVGGPPPQEARQGGEDGEDGEEGGDEAVAVVAGFVLGEAGVEVVGPGGEVFHGVVVVTHQVIHRHR